MYKRQQIELVGRSAILASVLFIDINGKAKIFCVFSLKNVDEIIETLRPHIRDISFRTYYRKRREAMEALSSVLWGYTSKDSLDMLEQFFPCLLYTSRCV